VPVWHQLYPGRHFDPDHVRTGLCGVTDNDAEANRRREDREGLPINIFRQDRFEYRFVWLVFAWLVFVWLGGSNHHYISFARW
jgi:hypothetical protein